VRRRLDECGARVGEHRIAPLSWGWNTPLPEGYLKSACAPLERLMAARRRIGAGELDAVLISGTDSIKSSFDARSAERDRLMRAYGMRTFLDASDQLAGAFESAAIAQQQRVRRTRQLPDRDLLRNLQRSRFLLRPNSGHFRRAFGWRPGAWRDSRRR
jgi:hypothetical protein